MTILALDTSAVVASVALCDGDELIAEFTVNNGNTHSETLLPMIESLLKISGRTLADIDAFACSSGPGSFTGVRIGAATLKGIAFDSGKPCVEVSTLEALAYNLKMEKGLICPVMNARRSQVYTALFSSDGNEFKRLMDDSPLSVEELDDTLSKYENTPIFFCGDGYDVTVPAMKKTVFNTTAKRLVYQSAYSVACVAAHKLKNNDFISDSDLRVTYLRPSQAERERLERQAEQK